MTTTSLRNRAAPFSRSIFIATTLGFSISGCTTMGNMLSISEVKPWERETLAKDNMQLDHDSMDSAIDDHIYFSREASTGGGGVVGGGCGCN